MPVIPIRTDRDDEFSKSTWRSRTSPVVSPLTPRMPSEQRESEDFVVEMTPPTLRTDVCVRPWNDHAAPQTRAAADELTCPAFFISIPIALHHVEAKRQDPPATTPRQHRSAAWIVVCTCIVSLIVGGAAGLVVGAVLAVGGVVGVVGDNNTRTRSHEPRVATIVQAQNNPSLTPRASAKKTILAPARRASDSAQPSTAAPVSDLERALGLKE